MFFGGGESPEKFDKGSQNNVHFAENELPLQQQEEPSNMPTSPSNKPILEGTLIYRKDGRRLKTKNLRTVSCCEYLHCIVLCISFSYLTTQYSGYLFIIH